MCLFSCSGSVKKFFTDLCLSKSNGSHTCRNTSCHSATKAKHLLPLRPWQLQHSSPQWPSSQKPWCNSVYTSESILNVSQRGEAVLSTSRSCSLGVLQRATSSRAADVRSGNDQSLDASEKHIKRWSVLFSFWTLFPFFVRWI